MTTLNTEAVNVALSAKGWSPARLAEQMAVSRESVSKWLAGEATPRPDKLLKLALLLGLSRTTLLGTAPDQLRPQVAFRMAKGKAAKDDHVERARHMGKMLEALVPYLPFDKFETPPALKNPSIDYDYLQSLAQTLRQEMAVSQAGVINVTTLARLFAKLQAVIVPVLWGHRKQHENAIHLYLPRTATTWVYLNLDTRLCDLKFWLAHELGHTYTFTSLQGDAGEDFADSFAGALLFPEAAAAPLYQELARVRSIHSRVARLMAVAQTHEISIICVGKQLDVYAAARGLPKLIDEAPAMYQISEMSKPPLASVSLFGTEHIELTKLIDTAASVFHTPFFSALKKFQSQNGNHASYLQGILDCALVDAKHIARELA
jgi:transcriptional regulator with XRE-family HTH domain/Zn-dependent peptidase ImmA (M78 family)